MQYFKLTIVPESADLDERIEQLSADAFGPGRFARAAFRLREGVAPDPQLSFVAFHEDAFGNEKLAGSVRLTRILIGGKQALVLGPLVVLPEFKSLGIGRELMHRALHEARLAGHELVILVGDYPYYNRFGFERAPAGRIVLPGPADPARTLYCELVKGSLEHYEGRAMRMVQECNGLAPAMPSAA